MPGHRAIETFVSSSDGFEGGFTDEIEVVKKARH